MFFQNLDEFESNKKEEQFFTANERYIKTMFAVFSFWMCVINTTYYYHQHHDEAALNATGNIAHKKKAGWVIQHREKKGEQLPPPPFSYYKKLTQINFLGSMNEELWESAAWTRNSNAALLSL